MFSFIKAMYSGNYNNNNNLQNDIGSLYDQSSVGWENMWGEHLHHGFYKNGEKDCDRLKAQHVMMEVVLDFANPKLYKNNDQIKILDVGCGLGGSSRFLAEKFNATVYGITLSAYQKQRAEEISRERGLSLLTKFFVADALEMPFESNYFDFIWSLESAEHIPKREQFISQMKRVCKKNGTIVIVTWCHRPLKENETLKNWEDAILNRISYCYYLPRWWSINDYKKCLEDSDFTDIKCVDWTDNIQPFWPKVLKSIFTFKGLYYLITSGWKTFRGAVAILLMIHGFKKNLIRFSAVRCNKNSD